MADPAGPPDAHDPQPVLPPRRRGLRVAGAMLGASALVLAAVWSERTTLADKLIASQLKTRGLPATYRIESIGTGRQVLRDIVVGDPAHPDLTIERAEIETGLRLGVPTVERVVLVRPWLRARLVDGRVSFGALDRVLAGPATANAGLPDLDVTLIGARAGLASGYGAIGAAASGSGNLRDGFAGQLALAAPHLAAAGCALNRAQGAGRLSSAHGSPRFAGPVAAASLACGGARIAAPRLTLDLSGGAALDSLSGTAAFASGRAAMAGQQARALDGTVRAAFARGEGTASYRIAAQAVRGAAAADNLAAEGIVRTHDRFARIDGDGTLGGAGLGLGAAAAAALAQAQRAAAGTLAAPLLARLDRGLAAARRGNRLRGSYLVHSSAGALSVIVPEAALTGAGGAPLVRISRAALTRNGAQGARVSGHLLTGGPDLPALSADLARAPGGAITARLAMADYAAGDARLALPELRVVQTAGGAVGFAGAAVLSGAFPGGRARDLALPIDGNWSAAAGLAMGRRCQPVRFASLTLANLALDRQAITLCPAPGGAMVRAGRQVWRIAATAPALALHGRLGDSPLALTSGAVGLGWPGALRARTVAVELGPRDHANRLTIAALGGALGASSHGTFAGASAHLDAVPLDLTAASGGWTFAGGRLSLGEGAFTVSDRQMDARFSPLVARGAVLTLAGGAIAAKADLREPRSDRLITTVTIAHDLARGAGHADLAVPGIVFDDKLQPDRLSHLTADVVQLVKGTAKGNGRIDWADGAVTSSGRFGSDWLDFAAAFGPVSGAQGMVEFTDLLGLVTAPAQTVRLAAINPGIEVNDGTVTFAIQPGGVVAVDGAHWPFVGGTLDLMPTQMVLGAAEVRRFTLKVEGMDAAQFVQHLELANIAATGTFDGTLPLVFDQNGGRIEDGLLVSRPPGGNVAYVGELTYKDLSPMGNFAFDALRSVDYRQMQIGFAGSLTGELVTRVSFEGLGQGKGARRNFLTRQVARLPLHFNVNIHAPFFGLFGSLKSLYDPSLVADPRAHGLLDSPTAAKAGVQPAASETVR